MNLSLYSWQQECLIAWARNQGRGIIQVVTGAGKTIVALAAARELQKHMQGKLQIKIVVPKTFMVAQWTASLTDNFGVSRSEIGWYYGNHKDSPTRQYMIYVVNSARYTLSRHCAENLTRGESVLLIADECHHYASSENSKIFEFIQLVPKEGSPSYYSLGLSATPQTEGFSKILVPALGPVIYTYGFSEAIKSKVINSCTIFNIGLFLGEQDGEQYQKYSDTITILLVKLVKKYPMLKQMKGPQFIPAVKRLANKADHSGQNLANNLLITLYKRRSLVYEAEERVDCALFLVSRLEQKAKIIIFGERIDQCDTLFFALDKEYPNRVARYHSDMGEVARKHAVQRYRDGDVRILVSCRALDEGFDIPAADVGIVLSSSSVERQRIQRLGRILRRSSNKGISSLYYFYMEQTVEDSALLEHSIDDVQEFFLNYKTSFHVFEHPVYDKLAEQVLDKLLKRQKELLSTAEYFLELGQVRADWIKPKEELMVKKEHAETREELNYWICMLAMAREREKESNIEEAPLGLVQETPLFDGFVT